MDVVKESDIKAHINGVAAEMKEFDFFYYFAFCFLKESYNTYNLSKTIQTTAMPTVEGHRLVSVVQ